MNGFARDGRVLVVMGVPGGKGVREETLCVLSPARLGLKDGLRYRVADLRNNCYLGAARSTAELAKVPVRLSNDDPLILLIEPESLAARLVWFRGADEVVQSGEFDFKVKAVPGSPLELYLDEAGRQLRSATPGFERKAAGDFTVFSGAVPADGRVKLAR